MSTDLTIDLWTDVVCPFCYIGEARLHKALEAEGVNASIRVHSFQLDPTITEPMDGMKRFVEQKGMSREQAEQMEAQLQKMAEAEGLTYSTSRLQGPTLPIHRITQLVNGTDPERGATFFRAVQTAYFEGTLNSLRH